MNNNLKGFKVEDFICNFPRGPPFISLNVVKSILIIRRIYKMAKKFNKQNNRNNPFKHGGYSMMQSHKDKVAYKNKQLESKRQTMELLNILMNHSSTVNDSPSLTSTCEPLLGVDCISVGEKFPYNFETVKGILTKWRCYPILTLL